jgi:hypothetical protein
MIRNLVPINTASRSERSANRSLYQGNCARAGFSLPVRPFSTDQCCVRLCRADLREHLTLTDIGYTFEPKAQSIMVFERKFD